MKFSSLILLVVPALAQTPKPATPLPSGSGANDYLLTNSRGLPVQTIAPPPLVSAALQDLPGGRIALTQISESRSNNTRGSGSTALMLTVSADSLPSEALVRQIIVTTAVDNLGHSIAPSALSSAAMSLARFNSTLGSFGGRGRGGIGGFPATVNLGAVDRDADSIQLLEGQIEFYLPSETNGAILRFPGIVAHAGRIEDPALTNLGLQLNVYLDEAMFEQLGREMFSSIGGAGRYGPNAVGLYYRDPTNLLAGWQLQDGQGRQLPSNGNSRGSNGGVIISQTRLTDPPPKDTQLVLFFTPPASLKKVPFRLENIPLP